MAVFYNTKINASLYGVRMVDLHRTIKTKCYDNEVQHQTIERHMKKLTRIRHKLHVVAHHTHFMQTGLPVKQNETVDFGISSQFANKPPVLTLHPSNVAQQSTHTIS